MFLAHSFRLRDPWQCECTLDGATRWSRVFHRPTGLEDDDALWLVCSGLPAGAEVTFNGAALLTPCATGVSPVRGAEPLTTPSTGDTPVPPKTPPHQYEVTALLADTNKVELLIPAAPSPVPRPPSTVSFPYDLRLGVVGHS